ncbi:hypothetical protein PGB90_006775 [Kerria lacca]
MLFVSFIFQSTSSVSMEVTPRRLYTFLFCRITHSFHFETIYLRYTPLKNIENTSYTIDFCVLNGSTSIFLFI